MIRQAMAGMLALLAGSVCAAGVVRWVDADGQVHYSDRPPPEAQKVEEVELAPPPPPEAWQAARQRILKMEQAAAAARHERQARKKPQKPAPASPATVSVLETIREGGYYPTHTRPPRIDPRPPLRPDFGDHPAYRPPQQRPQPRPVIRRN